MGHRSLLALPEGTEIKDRLNRLKFRQWYRPVAPMIADEDLEAVFGYVAKSPYMYLGCMAIGRDAEYDRQVLLHMLSVRSRTAEARHSSDSGR